KGKKAGPPVFDDHVQRVFRADAPNRVWLTDITEHRTTIEGKLYCCAIKDVFSNRIVGYSISDRMTSKVAVDALRNAVARRGAVAGCVAHADSGKPDSEPPDGPGTAPARHGRFDGPSRRRGRQRSDGELLVAPADQRPQPAAVDHPAGSAARHRRLDRAGVSPATSPGLPRRLDPHRVRVRAGRAAHPRGLNHTCHQFVPHAHDGLVPLEQADLMDPPCWN